MRLQSCPPLPRPTRDTSAAIAHAARDERVTLVERVPTLAMALGRMPCRLPSAGQNVVAHAEQAHVRSVDAGRVHAQMVYRHAFRNRPERKLVGDSVGTLNLATSFEPSVAPTVSGRHPRPAFGISSPVYFLPESVSFGAFWPPCSARSVGYRHVIASYVVRYMIEHRRPS